MNPAWDHNHEKLLAIPGLDDELRWSNKGTTQVVSWVKNYAGNAVFLVPQLLDKVDSELSSKHVL